MCKKCNTKFCQTKNDAKRTVFKNVIKENLAQNDPRFNDFCEKVAENYFSNIDFIIDGANVGYFEQRPDLGGTLSYYNIDKVVKQLPGTKLIFLHEMHNREKYIC